MKVSHMIISQNLAMFEAKFFSHCFTLSHSEKSFIMDVRTALADSSTEIIEPVRIFGLIRVTMPVTFKSFMFIN